MADNSRAFAELEAFIARVEGLRTLNEQVAKEAEKGVADVVRENIGAAVAPGGDAWPERKLEGGKALRGAASALESSAKGNKIVLQIGPPYCFHNWGAGGSSTTTDAVRRRAYTKKRQAKTGKKSKFHAPRRQILPVAGEPLPAKMREVIDEAATRLVGKVTG